MESQIRLAERQGLLRGHDLSTVQVRALDLLIRLDDAERGKKLQRELRRTAVEVGWDTFTKIFAEYVRPEDLAPIEDEVDEELLDEELEGGTGTVFDFSKAAPVSEAEADAMFNQLLSQSSMGSMGGDDVFSSGAWH